MSASIQPHLAYRPDIDGLRAVAVLAVVVHHAFPGALTGGFVGVDVFFVISGCLISKLLFAGQARDGRIDFADFYRRRVRRIFPALALVLLAALLAGWFLLSPGGFRELGKHVIGGAGFVSNLLLWRESGYFDAAAGLKPLLHLWSLGVEEQFYLVWPVTLWAAWKAKLDRRVLLGATIAASFALNLWMARHDPVGDFYSPLTRFWELGVGAWLAHRSLRDGMRLPARVADVLSVSGLCVIVVACVWVDPTLAFPGAWAVLPVAGAAMSTAAGPDAVGNRVLLAAKPMVWIGLISYPLYLWHWPLFTFARLAVPDALMPTTVALLIVASFVLAWATYRFVERPMRFDVRRRPAFVLVVAMGAVAMCGGVTFAMQGVPARYEAQIAAYANFRYDFLADARRGSCWLERAAPADGFAPACTDASTSLPRMVLWGDSHAARFSPGLRAEARGFAVSEFARDSCLPVLDEGAYENCAKGNAFVAARIRALRPQVVVLFANWANYWGEVPDTAVLDRTLDALREAGVPHVVVMGQAPVWRTPLPTHLVRLWQAQPAGQVPRRSTQGLWPQPAVFDRALAAYVRSRGDATYFSTWRTLCDARGCLARTGDGADTLTSYDEAHFTTNGAAFVARALRGQTHDFADFR